MNRPDPRLMHSLARLHDTSPEVIQWFVESLEDQKDVNIDLKGEEGIRGQGKAEVLREIVEFITVAPDAIKKNQGESQRALHNSTRGI